MSEYRVRIGRNGTKVHRANADGNTFCGSQRRGNRAVSFLPADTPVTCEKCGADEVAATETPAQPALCPNHSYPQKLASDGTCPTCDY